VAALPCRANRNHGRARAGNDGARGKRAAGSFAIPRLPAFGGRRGAAQALETLAQALYDQAADLQKNGVGTGIDTLRANVQLQNEKQRVIVTRTQLETGLFALAAY